MKKLDQNSRCSSLQVEAESPLMRAIPAKNNVRFLKRTAREEISLSGFVGPFAHALTLPLPLDSLRGDRRAPTQSEKGWRVKTVKAKEDKVRALTCL